MMLNRKGNPQRILDLLEVDGGSMTIRQLVAEFQHRWPQVAEGSVQRASQRLIERGAVETRWVPQAGYPGRHGTDTVRQVHALRAS